MPIHIARHKITHFWSGADAVKSWRRDFRLFAFALKCAHRPVQTITHLYTATPYLLKLQFCLHSTLLMYNALNINRFKSVYTLALWLHCHIHSYTHAHYLHNVPTRGICHGRSIKRLCESGRAVRWTETSVWHYRKICPRLPLCAFVCHSIRHAWKQKVDHALRTGRVQTECRQNVGRV